ncbi:MAG: hypothetical protein ACE5JR_06255 [Gemmatimonadota bacterium]
MLRRLLFAAIPVFIVGMTPARPAVAGPQEKPRDQRLEEEFQSSQGISPSRRLESRRETEDRALERRVVEQPSINGGYGVVLEVEEETVRIDSRTSRRTRREFAPDSDGGRRLIQTIEEERVETPDGRRRIVRHFSQPDVNGRPRATRREVEVTAPEGAGIYRTEIEVSVPDINRSGFIPTERIEQRERRDGERVLEVDRTTYSYRAGHRSWQATERRTTNREVGEREVRTVERVYWLDGNDDLFLRDRIVSREWTDARGAEHTTEQVYTTDISALGRSKEPRLFQQIEAVRTTRPDGSWRSTREVRERGVNGLRLVERVIEESRPDGKGGTMTIREVQRADGNGRLRTVSVSRRSESES